MCWPMCVERDTHIHTHTHEGTHNTQTDVWIHRSYEGCTRLSGMMFTVKAGRTGRPRVLSFRREFLKLEFLEIVGLFLDGSFLVALVFAISVSNILTLVSFPLRNVEFASPVKMATSFGPNRIDVKRMTPREIPKPSRRRDAFGRSSINIRSGTKIDPYMSISISCEESERTRELKRVHRVVRWGG